MKRQPLAKVTIVYQLILTFGVGAYVRDFTSPAKFVSDPMSGRDATWGQHGSCAFFVLFVFIIVQ